MVSLPNYWIVNCCFSIELRHMEYIKDGLKHMQLKFYIEGSEPGLKGTVHSESKEVGVLFLKVQFFKLDTTKQSYSRVSVQIFTHMPRALSASTCDRRHLMWKRWCYFENVYFVCQVQKHFLILFQLFVSRRILKLESMSSVTYLWT